MLGLVLSVLLVRDTRHHVGLEISRHASAREAIAFWEVFRRASFGDRNLFAASQAGLGQQSERRDELGDFPAVLRRLRLGVERIGILNSVYPAVWGVLQTVTGPLSDRWGRKGLIVTGMWVQAGGLFLTAATRSFGWWLLASVLLGARHGDGLSDAHRRGLRRVAPVLARALAQRLSVLARPRLRRRRAVGGIMTDIFGASLGDRGRWRALSPVRRGSRDAHEGMAGRKSGGWSEMTGQENRSEAERPPILRQQCAASVFKPDALLREAGARKNAGHLPRPWRQSNGQGRG